MADDEIQYTASGKRKRASYQMVVEWINDVWRKVATDDAIMKGFKECGYIGYDGNADSLHSRLRDTMVNREVPPEVLTEVNEFVIQLEEERNETGCDLNDSVESEEDSDENERDEGDDVDVRIV